MPNFVGLPKRGTSRPIWPYTVNRKSWEAQGLVTWIPLAGTTPFGDLIGGGKGQFRSRGGYIQSPIFGPTPRFSSLTMGLVTNKRPINLGATKGSLTISAWVLMESIPAVQQTMLVCSGGGASSTDTTLALNSSHQWTFTRTGPVTNKKVSSSNVAVAGKWYHIVVTDDASLAPTNTHIYIDALEAASYPVANSADAAGSASGIFVLGQFSQADGFPLLGAMTDVRIYNYAMTLTEVKALRSAAPYFDLYLQPRQIWFDATVPVVSFLPRLTVLGAG